jgi:hypothetical protein
MEGDEDGGEEKDKEAEDPHERAGKDLIFKGSDAEERRRFDVGGIEDAITEDEERAEGSAGKGAEKEIKGDGPAWPTRFRGKGLDDGPPKEDGRGEEAEVFQFVPGVGAEGEFEGGGNVPGEESDGGENPANEGMSEKFAKGLHRRPAEEWAESGADKTLRESVKERQGRGAKKDERRNNEHQQDVLDHVDGERSLIEGGQRRANRDPQREHARQKSGETPWREEFGRGAAQRKPPAQITECGEYDDHVDEDRWRPFLKDGLGFGRHDALRVRPGRRICSRLCGDGARSVASGRLVGGVKSFEEGDESRGFGRAEIFAVGGHVATALNDLANELVLGEEKRDFIESGAALAALVPE